MEAEEVTRVPTRPVLALAVGVEMKDSAVEMSAISVLAAAAAWFFIFPPIFWPPTSALSLSHAVVAQRYCT